MSQPNSQPVDYKSAGVDLDTYEETMAQLPPLLRRTYTPRVIEWPGGFAGLMRQCGAYLRHRAASKN